MLMADARNFHGWAHRMRVRAIQQQLEVEDCDSLPEDDGKGLRHAHSDKKEFEFVHSKINDDFANYSAWHHRSVLLPRIHNQKKIYQETQTSAHHLFIRKELDFVKQAFYTEPDVQSAWSVSYTHLTLPTILLV